ncbi:glycosyltransferase family 4 protein [Candidatus Woesearchaeota archaeon]|jgi:glycogen synthase|nr:glycosyltransferase family 4 protein [Candidatus Woesearchaeota archaeon]MBT4368121.1 glycosyltransferase family 4 protein [Candidatus Woesearchaeota archaeon]MBT4712609.1 glycosyltransferase family 4 protein [Candidatus Woesearchaeota archaeon]MBT6639522.1 glycosyltransferase family 4 protein [Candidatus Woesearchaeota archaeon]MBT7133694.1 glycosyltransferase family 4 protein [Candidatus Woesearchaeota archaeon]
MEILMFGWEFPPMKSGGLGTACYDLCKGLFKQGTKVTFVVPRLPKTIKSNFVKLLGANQYAKLTEVDSILTPYMTSNQYLDVYDNLDVATKQNYGKNLLAEVKRYTQAAIKITENENFDIIHVHDWMTYEAGQIAKEKSGKSLVAHIHATEFDRTGGNPNMEISHKEYLGLNAADMIIANSEYTKDNVIKNYKVDADKLRVVHWGIAEDSPSYHLNAESPFKDSKVVLFLGRVTIQKGPDYFVDMAEKVKKYVPNVKFVFAGDGDMFPKIVDQVMERDLAENFVFTGFLRGEDVHKAFQMADLYAMPSVSEPFGLVALESIKNGTPVLLSKQSGVAEVLTNAFKVNFWDVDEMANKIVSFLNHPALSHDLKANTIEEAKGFNLDDPAKKCLDCYDEVKKW